MSKSNKVTVKEDNGFTYVGETKNGKKSGFGELFDSMYNLVYSGEWESGKINGEGKIFIKRHIDGEEHTLTYEGSFKNNKLHGRGVEEYLNGIIRYEGEFKDGLYDGTGIV